MLRQILLILTALFLMTLTPTGTCKAQTPVANRVKAFARSLNHEAHVVAKYTDNRRHCLYYTSGNRLFRYDVLTDEKTEVNFSTNSYAKILSTWLSPDGNYIFIAIDKGILAESYLINGQELWRYDSNGLKSKLIGSGFAIESKPKCIVIKKATRCLNPQAPADKQHWMAKNHYFNVDGTIIWAKEEYKIK